MTDEPQPLCFGRFTVLPLHRLLLVDGAPAELGGRAFDLLIALIEHRSRVVGKNELLDLVWPGLVVEEGNLKVQVSNLRRLIGAEAIATVPARGYRFALPLEVDSARSPGTSPRPATAFDLPSAADEMVGREDDLAALQRLLREHRLVTVLGAGGIGKTTLALAAARAESSAHAQDVVWVDLSAVASLQDVPVTVAKALGVVIGDPDAVLPTLVAVLRSRSLLVVLDNAEHLVAGVATLAQTLAGSCDQVKLLVTSQAPIKLPNEHVFRLGPLRCPEAAVGLDEALAYGAVELFCKRAVAVQQQFRLDASNVTTVVGICRGLDGLALAIELAAARLPLFGLEGLSSRLDRQLRLLSGGARSAPTRQQTLLAALDWSHGLLPEHDKTVFRRLAVFSGGFTLELAAQVASDAALDEWAVIDIVGTLIERSLVSADGANLPRYRLLESARAFASMQLDAAGESFVTKERHARVLAAFALRGEEALWSTPEPTWLAQNALELDNIRAALDWSTLHEPTLAIALVGASFHLFNCMALLYESRRRCDALAPELESVSASLRDKARFLRARSSQMRDVSVAAQHQLALQSTELFRECGDDAGLYESLYGITRGFQTYPAEATAAALEMVELERSEWPPAFRALGKIAESTRAYVEGRMAENRSALEAALPLVTKAGADRLTMVVLGNLADHVLLMGPLDEAARRGRELVALLRRTGRTALLPLALCNLVNALLQQGATAEARPLLEQAFVSMRTQQWAWLRGFGDVYTLLAAQERRFEDAARLLGWADEARVLRGPRQPNELRCRSLALDLITAALPQDRIDAFAREGAGLSPEQVRAMTLGEPA